MDIRRKRSVIYAVILAGRGMSKDNEVGPRGGGGGENHLLAFLSQSNCRRAKKINENVIEGTWVAVESMA